MLRLNVVTIFDSQSDTGGKNSSYKSLFVSSDRSSYSDSKLLDIDTATF